MLFHGGWGCPHCGADMGHGIHQAGPQPAPAQSLSVAPFCPQSPTGRDVGHRLQLCCGSRMAGPSHGGGRD